MGIRREEKRRERGGGGIRRRSCKIKGGNGKGVVG